MVIRNQSNDCVYVNGNRVIEPGSCRYVSEHVFDTINIHSAIGSIVITTEYCIRSISSFGGIVGHEIDDLDDNGHKIIVVSAVE